MPFYVAQGGTSLYRVTTAGVATALTLPAGIDVRSTHRLRGALLGNQILLVNSPSENLTLDKDANLRRLCPQPPASAPLLSATGSGTLTGSYQVKCTFFVKDAYGNQIAESSFGPVSNIQAVAAQYLKAAQVPLSAETISGRRLYRTTTSGTTYFPWIEIDGNTVTDVQDDQSDISLQLLAAPTDLGPPPKFELIAAWKNRLWGKPVEEIDTLYQSGNGKAYAFPASRTIPIPPTNADTTGISGFLPRRDELGIGKRNSLHKITGTNETNFTRGTVADGIGIWAPDSCVVVHDVGYFLGNPFGIYTWGPGGIKNVSDPKVKAWFESDTYFNRAEFDNAWGFYDPTTNSYILLLSGAGVTTLNRWIQYDIATGNFWGPHKTDAFTPTGGVTLRDTNDVAIPVIFGSDGKLYKSQTTKTDATSTGVDFDVTTNFLSGNSPTVMKFWDQPEIATKVLASGTLTITPTVGKLNAAAGAPISHTMTTGHEALRRLGTGELCQLRFQNSVNAINTVIYGIELPFSEVGQR